MYRICIGKLKIQIYIICVCLQTNNNSVYSCNIWSAKLCHWLFHINFYFLNAVSVAISIICTYLHTYTHTQRQQHIQRTTMSIWIVFGWILTIIPLNWITAATWSHMRCLIGIAVVIVCIYSDDNDDTGFLLQSIFYHWAHYICCTHQTRTIKSLNRLRFVFQAHHINISPFLPPPQWMRRATTSLLWIIFMYTYSVTIYLVTAMILIYYTYMHSLPYRVRRHKWTWRIY